MLGSSVRRLLGRDTPRAETAAGCVDLRAATGDVKAGAVDFCEDCAALDENVWAHLRMCLTCGHVGCCDSSPHQHATEHFRLTGHPVMRSHEPGESWRWCYVHNLMG